jgi:predicted metalloprotease
VLFEKLSYNTFILFLYPISMANWGKILSRGNVEDRRSMRPAAIGGIGVTGVLVLMGINLLLGGNPLDMLNQLQSISPEQQVQDNTQFDGNDSYEVFASTVLGSNNDMWTEIFSSLNKTYEEPKLVLFRDVTESGCGFASSQVGPHYCHEDDTVYLDETFFNELTTRFGAKGGDVAEAYVISHEVGHHAQNLLGILDSTGGNQASIGTELQADCFAGLWANSIRDKQVFEPGEIHEAMDAAAAVGDDRIQKEVTGHFNPETWTHGSSQQRLAAFDTGYEKGLFNACFNLNE